MNRFHSSGTASGNIEVMLRWKRIIPTIAIVRTTSLSTNTSRNGQVNSCTVPKCEKSAASREGRMSSG